MVGVMNWHYTIENLHKCSGINIALAPKNGQQLRMIKLLVGTSLLVLAAGGAWAFGTRGAQKLDQLDRLWGSNPGRLTTKDVPYGSDARQKLDMYVPYNGGALSDEARPVLVFFYGGSWNSGNKADYAFAAKAYAARGFVVALPDYRLAPAVHFPAFVEDAAAAVAKVRSIAPKYGADPNRIVLVGHSAGGHSALMLALDPQWLNAVGVPLESIKGVAALSAPTDFYPFTKGGLAEAALDGPNPELTQPVNFARADAPPLWLGTGSDDTTVKPRNSRILAEAQEKLGATAIFKQYDGLDHTDPLMALARPFAYKAPILLDSSAFLQQVVSKENVTPELGD